MLRRPVVGHLVVVDDHLGHFGHVSVAIGGRTEVATRVLRSDARELEVVAVDANISAEHNFIFRGFRVRFG